MHLVILEDPGVRDIRLPRREAIPEGQRLLLRQDEACSIGRNVLQFRLPWEENQAVFLAETVWHHEAGMSANGKEHFLFSKVLDRPFNSKLLSGKPMANGEAELVGINTPCLLAISQAVGDGSFRLFNACEYLIPSKAMLGFHGIFILTDAIFAILHLPHKREQNGGMPVPYSGIGVPNTFAPGRLVPHADQFSSGVCNGDL